MGWIFYRMRPANVELRDRNARILLVREAYVIVIFLSVDCRGIDQASIDAPRVPRISRQDRAKRLESVR